MSERAFEVKLAGDLSQPRCRVLAVEGAVQIIAQEAGVDPADGTMMLLTAAVHLAMRYSGKRPPELMQDLAYALGCAVTAADEFFPECTLQ